MQVSPISTVNYNSKVPAFHGNQMVLLDTSKEVLNSGNWGKNFVKIIPFISKEMIAEEDLYMLRAKYPEMERLFKTMVCNAKSPVALQSVPATKQLSLFA